MVLLHDGIDGNVVLSLTPFPLSSRLADHNSPSCHCNFAWHVVREPVAEQYADPPTGDCAAPRAMVASMERSPHSATKISEATCTHTCFVKQYIDLFNVTETVQ